MLPNPDLGDLRDPNNPARLHGLYQLQGRNPDDSIYSGSVEISYQAMFEVYKIIWTIESDPKQYLTGRGKLNDNRLVAQDSDLNTITYTVQPDGTLRGIWTAENGSTGEELLARV